jgi:hypothetical protein
MSANNEMIVVKKAEDRYEVYMNGCVDNDYDYTKDEPIFVEKTPKEAFDKAEGIGAEYGLEYIDASKSPSEPEQTECQSEHSHKVGFEPRVAGTSRSLERQSQSTDTPSESSARNICKACGFDKDAPRKPIVCDSNPLSIASYFEDQCEGCGHKKDGSNIISPAEPGQGVRGHGADARVASVKGLDLPPESSGREIDRDKMGTFDKSSIKNDVLEQLYPKSMVTNCEHEWSGDDVAKHCIKCGVGEDIIEAIDLTLAAVLALLDAKIVKKRHYLKSTQRACGKDDMDTQWMIGKVEALRELRAGIEKVGR